MNFVIYDAILIIVDRLIKMMHYILVTKTINAKDLVEILIKDLVRMHELLESIVIDRDFVFTSKYWFSLCYALKIKEKLFIAFHSQIDDQTKRQNSTMKQYLRAYINFEQNDWIQLLFMIEFAYNNAINVFTSMILFETNQNYHFRMFFENNQNLKVKSKFAKNNVKHLQKLLNVFRANLIDAQVKQAKYENKRTLFKKHFVKQYVMLNEKKIRIKRNKKLKWKHFELFQVLKTIKDQVCRLELLKRWRIHDVFHVSLLKKSKFKKKRNTTIELTYQSKIIKIEKDEIIKKLYKIEIILNNHIYVANKCLDQSYNESKLL